MRKTHKLDFFHGERFEPLRVGQNRDGRAVNIMVRRCDVVECELLASAVRGKLQLCSACAKQYDAEQNVP